MLVKCWSNAGQMLVQCWSNAGRNGRTATARTCPGSRPTATCPPYIAIYIYIYIYILYLTHILLYIYILYIIHIYTNTPRRAHHIYTHSTARAPALYLGPQGPVPHHVRPPPRAVGHGRRILRPEGGYIHINHLCIHHLYIPRAVGHRRRILRPAPRRALFSTHPPAG